MQPLSQSLKAYAVLMRFHKPVGIMLLLWPTCWALWLASNGPPPIKLLAIFVLGVIIMRAAGCVINDIADRHIDGHVERTQYRPLVVGDVTVSGALLTLGVLLLLALVLVLQLNRYTVQLACGAALLTLLYPFMKRVTHWPQLVLGTAFACSTLMAFAATQQTVPAIAWLLFVITVIWTIIYDTQYAMVDRDDDLRIGVKSTAVLFGRYARIILLGLQGMVLILLVALGRMAALHWCYFVLLLPITGLIYFQQKCLQGRRDDYFRAFMSNIVVGGLIWLAIMCGITY